MKIKLLADYRGVLTGEQFFTAGEHDLPGGMAQALINEGRAELAERDEPTGEKQSIPGVGEEIAAALWNAGYKSLADIAAAPDADLLKISGIGKGRLKQIRESINGLL
jgi:predicted flap endonuclease-1-like 5' DNA nuclease